MTTQQEREKAAEALRKANNQQLCNLLNLVFKDDEIATKLVLALVQFNIEDRYDQEVEFCEKCKVYHLKGVHLF